jgi:hypothetical protein
MCFIAERTGELPEDEHLDDSDLFHPEDQSTGMPDMRPHIPGLRTPADPHVAESETDLKPAPVAQPADLPGQSADPPTVTAHLADFPVRSADTPVSPSADPGVAAAQSEGFTTVVPKEQEAPAGFESSTSSGVQLSGTVTFLQILTMKICDILISQS